MRVLLFGVTRDIVGSDSLDVSDFCGESSQSVAELKSHLGNLYPDLNKLSSLAIAVNSEYAEADVLLSENDEIALIPPVSGG